MNWVEQHYADEKLLDERGGSKWKELIGYMVECCNVANRNRSTSDEIQRQMDGEFLVITASVPNGDRDTTFASVRVSYDRTRREIRSLGYRTPATISLRVVNGELVFWVGTEITIDHASKLILRDLLFSS